MKTKAIGLYMCMLFCQHIYAEDYTFQLHVGNAIADKTETLDNGAIYMTFPAGTDVNNLGLSCTVPEGAVVSPDPSKARIRDNEVEIFTVTYADGTKRAFPYYFSSGRWFTVILFGDPEVNMTGRYGNNATEENLSKWANGIINMKHSGRYAFKSNTHIKPSPDLVICMGDMDEDQGDGKAISGIFDLFTSANIPFVTMAGNHDIAPDYWTADNSDMSLKAFGTAGNSNQTTFNLITGYLDKAQSNGIEDVKRFTQDNGNTQPQPYTFTFKGVRFYIGQTYWFQKPYTYNWFTNGTYYAPNGIIESLTSFVEEHKNTPSVWVQHYPISCADRWWLDQNEGGYSVAPSDSPTYATATEKRNKYMDLITKTQNPYHFSGHNHAQATVNHNYNGTAFKDYIAPYFATEGGAWMVLCHEGEGVVEVQSVNFNY